jgi:hypothetical protein
MHLPLAVAVKVHTHAIPSHAAGAELQSGLRTVAGLVANPVTGRARVAVYKDRVWGEKTEILSIFPSVISKCKRVLHTYICCIPLIKYSQRGDRAWWDEPSLVEAGGQGVPTLNHKCRATYRYTMLALTIVLLTVKSGGVPTATSRTCRNAIGHQPV